MLSRGTVLKHTGGNFTVPGGTNVGVQIFGDVCLCIDPCFGWVGLQGSQEEHRPMFLGFHCFGWDHREAKRNTDP